MLFLLACNPPPIALLSPGDTGTPDSGTVAEDGGAWGDGADGDLTVTTELALSEWIPPGRTAPAAVYYLATAAEGTIVELAQSPEGLAPGDEVLILDMQGTDTSLDAVGDYQFATLVAVDGALTLGASIPWFNAEEHVVLVQRVPHYTDVTVTSGGVLTAARWTGAGGGVLAMRASGTVLVEGHISAASIGYRGGATGDGYNCDGYQGESWGGIGEGGYSDGYNQSAYGWDANEGGGGSSVTGAGGEHAGGALPGDTWYDGRIPPEPGETYGDASLVTLRLGSGGGGVWNDGSVSAGPGGAGGGIVFLAARSASVTSASGIVATGEDGTAWSQGAYSYGAGGGAGGSIWLQAGEVTLAGGALDARGGLGETNHERWGGDGGTGRVRIDCDTIGGAVCSADTLAEVAEPAVGFVGAAP